VAFDPKLSLLAMRLLDPCLVRPGPILPTLRGHVTRWSFFDADLS
jgi:hypothetical protein